MAIAQPVNLTEIGPLTLVVGVEDGKLIATVERVASKATLVPYRGNMFKVKEQEGVTFEFVLEGDTVAKVVVQPGGVFRPVK